MSLFKRIYDWRDPFAVRIYNLIETMNACHGTIRASVSASSDLTLIFTMTLNQDWMLIDLDAHEHLYLAGRKVEFSQHITRVDAERAPMIIIDEDIKQESVER